MSNNSTAIKSIFIIITFSLISKVLGLIREMLIAARLGSGSDSDIFFIALTVTGLFTTFITKAVNTSIIPVLSEIDVNEGKDTKILYANNFLNVFTLLSIFIFFISYFISPFLVRITAHGFDEAQLIQATNLTRIGFPVVIFSTILGIFRGYLHTEDSFFEGAATQLPYNFVIILYLLLFVNFFSLKGLMITSVVAVVAQIIFQIPSLKTHNFEYKFTFNLTNKYIKRIIILVLPILISAVANDVNNIIDKSLASTLKNGSISALNYSYKLNSLILSIFITAITTVLFPILSREAYKNNLQGVSNVLSKGINITLIITIPSTIAISILANPVVKILFERGQFDNLATNMTAEALTLYSVGLTGLALKLLLDKGYYALQDTKTPMLNGLLSIFLNIIFNLLFINYFQHGGLALATSISATIGSLLLYLKLNRRLQISNFKNISLTFLKVLFSSVIMGIFLKNIYKYLSFKFYGIFIIDSIVLLICVISSILLYLIIIIKLNIYEIDWVKGILKIRFKKLKS